MKNRIFDVCDQLAEQGIKPTLIRVRGELGGGSFSTINPLVKQWKEERKMSNTQTTAELYYEIATINQKASAAIWKAVSDHFDEIQQAQQEKLANLSTKMARSDALISMLQKKLGICSGKKQYWSVSSFLVIKKKHKSSTPSV